LRLAYSYYSLGKIQKAIDGDSKGLKISEEKIENPEAEERFLKFKNSLAY
jgi:hypothetical protein